MDLSPNDVFVSGIASTHPGVEAGTSSVSRRCRGLSNIKVGDEVNERPRPDNSTELRSVCIVLACGLRAVPGEDGCGDAARGVLGLPEAMLGAKLPALEVERRP